MRSPVSYSALRTFVEVGRTGKLAEAASALNVTPGAVSQQLKMLEAVLGGAPLFRREGRTLKLSRTGESLLRRLSPGFQQIDAGIDLFRAPNPGSGRLTVSTPPAFASCWLASRLGRFTQRHPAIEVNLETSVELADVANGGADVAIRHGSGDYPGLDARLLFEPQLIVIAHPRLVSGRTLSASDCLRFPLLQSRDRGDWLSWLGLDEADAPPETTRGASYASDALLIEAAASGQGLAVVRDHYAQDAIAAGRVVLANPRKIATRSRYFVVTRTARLASANTKSFRRWLLEECARPRVEKPTADGPAVRE